MRHVDHIDPCLLADEMDSVDYALNKAIGASSHLHRGFQTVAYVMSRAMEHEDSIGTPAAFKP